MGYRIVEFAMFAEYFLKLNPSETPYAILLDVLLRRGTIKPEQCLPGLICSRAELEVFEKNGISIDQPHRMDDCPHDRVVRNRGRVTGDAGIDPGKCVIAHLEISTDSDGNRVRKTYYWIPDTNNVGPIIRAMYA
jgi:hypothetical protein